MNNERYPRNEIHNLARFISVMKFRPLIWRTTHPYVYCDRFEDLTDAEVLKLHKNFCFCIGTALEFFAIFYSVC